jgi:hypothetical protein
MIEDVPSPIDLRRLPDAYENLALARQFHEDEDLLHA